MVELPNETDFMHVWTFGSPLARADARSRKNVAARFAGTGNVCEDRLGIVNVPTSFDRSAMVHPAAFVDPELVIVAPSSLGVAAQSTTKATRRR